MIGDRIIFHDRDRRLFKFVRSVTERDHDREKIGGLGSDPFFTIGQYSDKESTESGLWFGLVLFGFGRILIHLNLQHSITLKGFTMNVELF